MASKVNEILAHFDRTVDQYISRDEFKAKLRLGRPLRIKYGVDVRTPTLHIGHAVNLWLMRYLQEQGHKVVFVIGDFTTRIGDPDGRLDACAVMDEEEVENNIRVFLEQAKTVLLFDNPKLIEVRRNSEWYSKLSMREFMDISSLVTHARLMARDMFQMRMAQGREIYLQEMLYPLLRAYDSLVVESDLAIVGSDQLFNESLARLLQEKFGKPPQALITTKITPGIDGKAKQSKSLGNYIGLLHSPRDKFGRAMSIPDHLIEEFFRVYTDVGYSQISGFKAMLGKKPRDAKMALAYALVERYHGQKAAEEERDWFENTISKGHAPDDMPTLGLVNPRIETLELVRHARPGKSKSDIRRLIKQGAVELNGELLKEPDRELLVKTHDVLKVGKRDWFRIIIVEVADLDTENLLFKKLAIKDIDFLSKYLPAWELVKHLGLAPHLMKPTLVQAREVFKKIITKPAPRDEWIWTIELKREPDKPIGVAHLRRTAGWEADQAVWLSPEALKNDEFLLNEALYAVNEYAFTALGMNTHAFKSAFAYATSPKEPDTLRRGLLALDTQQLNREVPEGTVGYTQEGWRMMQQWRRTMAPWLFQNDPQPQLKPQAKVKEPEPEPPPPKPKPKPTARTKNPYIIEPPVLKPPGLNEDED